MAIQQISVFASNQPGSLSTVLESLESASVDLRALSVADTNDFGIVRIIVNDTEKAAQVLTQANCLYKVNKVVAVKVSDNPGALKKLVHFMAEKGVNIEYLYAFLMPALSAACVVMRVEDPEKIDAMLSEAGFSVITEEKILN